MQQIQVTTPGPGGPVTATPVPADVPRTPQQFRGMAARQGLIKSQMEDLYQRRGGLQLQYNAASMADRPALQGRLDAIDQQLVSLERELDRVNAAMTAAPPSALTATTAQPIEDVILREISNEIVPLVAILTLFVLAPFTLAISWFIWKRASAPRRAPAGPDPTTMQRMEELQRSVDAIAIEVERISEGQRFVAKVLNERERIPARSSLPES